MCGIFAVLCGKTGPAPDPDELRRGVEALCAFRPVEGDREAAARAMETVEGACAAWVRPSGMTALLAAPARAEVLESALRRLEPWVHDLEARLASVPARNQEERERLNALLVAGKDAAWRLREDVLGNLPKIRALLGAEAEGSAAGETFLHAWALNLVLNSIDRLEVRGRDSAGVAAYVRFPSRAAVETFLREEDRRAFLERRGRDPAFGHGTVIRPAAAPDTLLFAFKVAEEVGEMGQNVRFLRKSMAEDRLFQAALHVPGVRVEPLGHTRWASNGVISLANCHPVDSTRLVGKGVDPASRGGLVAALNGDIDNFQALYKKYVEGRGLSVAPGVTTDAKIIPLVVAAHRERTGDLEEAFLAAMEEFEGSMAVCLLAADRPGTLLCGQKGSGQGLFVGIAEDAAAVASEMYGLVELTGRYVKAEGELVEGGRTPGECFRVHVPGTDGVCRLPGGEPVESARVQAAEITTRDIDRGEYPRFLLKEISQSRESVEKTLRGKVSLDPETGEAGIHLHEDVLPPSLVEGLRGGRIQRIVPTGQGTAAVAAEGVGYLLRAALAATGMSVTPMKATELSGHHLRDDMSDTLVVAVSQSGTTTDTNRTVDLVRERGAFVTAVVNRRNSDLVYKADSVLYTSDGRDIEMSVASTKAFYAQNVAGGLLALGLADALGLLSPEARAEKVRALLELPGMLDRVLALSPRIEAVAAECACRRRYWAVVGTGATKIAADEIRIKLSELCYKAIAVDHLEDKKHIDLSSEPLILVCASGLPPASVSDVVKEVAIFKAHNSLPIVIADEGERRFDPYAAHTIPVPRYEGALAFLLPTMVGHLFGYHAAQAFDRHADRMRRLRLHLVRELERGGEGLRGTELWKMLGRNPALPAAALEVQEALDSGALDSGLEVNTAVRLSTLLDFVLGRIPLDLFGHRFGGPGTVGALLARVVEELSRAVAELCRPIDAIKHQAKTVTVGISRKEERSFEGPLWSLFRALGLDPDTVAASHANVLSALEPLVEEVPGATLYAVEGLSPLGKPLETSTVRVEKKVGLAEKIPSRCESPARLAGTKWGVVADGKVFLGRGHRDRRPILIVPLTGPRSAGRLLLFHVALKSRGPRARRMAALRALQDRYKQLLIAFTEAANRTWDPAYVDLVDNEQLFFAEPRALSVMLRSALERKEADRPPSPPRAGRSPS